MIESTFSTPPRLLSALLDILLRSDEREALDAADPPVGIDMVAKADDKATSPPCESTIVVMHEFSGSGGSRTRVMMPGTTSEKCLDTKVDIKDDFPTPSTKRKTKRRTECKIMSKYTRTKEDSTR
jgi:hypothetical protein